MNYAIYARKSQESEERQVQSIDDQLRLTRALASSGSLGVTPEYVFVEAKSAKEPFARLKFQELIASIEQGHVDGIIAYHPNRLSRNETDGATIVRLLRTGKLTDLRFVSYHFENSPEGIMFLQLALSQSQYESAKLAREVRRGIDSRLQKGWWSSMPPAGYLNDPYTRTIVPDPERLPLIERAFRLLLRGDHTVTQVRRLLNDEWGYRSRRRKRRGGNPLSDSGAHEVFSNIFYAGYMTVRGECLPGSHPPIITLDEYREVQRLIHRYRYHRNGSCNYSGMIRCGRCGHAAVGEHHNGRHGRGRWVYYYCCGKKCSRPKRSIREAHIDEQIRAILATLTWPQEFWDTALADLRTWLGNEYESKRNIVLQRRSIRDDAERRRAVLLDLRLDGQVDAATFKVKDAELRETMQQFEDDAGDLQERFRRATETLGRVGEFLVGAASTWDVGGEAAKKQIAAALGRSYTLVDGVLTIECHPLLSYFMQPPEPQKPPSRKQKRATSGTQIRVGGPEAQYSEAFKLALEGEQMPKLNYIGTAPLAGGSSVEG